MSKVRVIGAVLFVGLAGAVALAAAAGNARTGVPAPPPFLMTYSVTIYDMEAVHGTNGAGRYSAAYSPAKRTLTWRLDYKLTTGPATAVRVRSRFGTAIFSRTLCRSCASVQRSTKKGPYLSVGGTIRNPSRDLLLLAVPPFGTVSQVVLATAEYPAGELYALMPPPPATGGGGRCC